MKTDFTMVIDNGGKRKRQNEQLGVEGVKMLKVRAALEKKGVYNLKATKTEAVNKNNLQPINGKLVSRDTFDEDSETDSECDLYQKTTECDLYQKTKLERDAKLAAKAQKYSRTAPSVLAAPETQLDGKRHINYEMEKNRGLTRKRNKDIKNPRKKYKLKHKKKETAREGQVRKHRKPTGTYSWEKHGINVTASRSIRLC